MWNDTLNMPLELMNFFTQKGLKVIPLKRVLQDIFRQMIGIFLCCFLNGFAPVGTRCIFNENGRTDRNMIASLAGAPGKKDIEGDV